jgi:hypothetical protein
MIATVALQTKCGGSSPFDYAQGQNDKLLFHYKFFITQTLKASMIGPQKGDDLFGVNDSD